MQLGGGGWPSLKQTRELAGSAVRCAREVVMRAVRARDEVDVRACRHRVEALSDPVEALRVPDDAREGHLQLSLQRQKDQV
jgi:hypothetical protein